MRPAEAEHAASNPTGELERLRKALRRADEERRRLAGALMRAHEDERRRIAAEIHGDQLYALGSVAARIGWVREQLRDEQHQEALQVLEREILGATLRLRQFLAAPGHPPAEESPVPALMRSLDRLERATGVRSRLRDELRGRPLPGTVGTALVVIAREALTNVERHADANEVEVRLELKEGGVALEVIDDGRGFAVAADEISGRLGLAAMQHRAREASGRLEVRSAVGQGTSVSAWLPVPS